MAKIAKKQTDKQNTLLKFGKLGLKHTNNNMPFQQKTQYTTHNQNYFTLLKKDKK
jgi:hypothetical protein